MVIIIEKVNGDTYGCFWGNFDRIYIMSVMMEFEILYKFEIVFFYAIANLF